MFDKTHSSPRVRAEISVKRLGIRLPFYGKVPRSYCRKPSSLLPVLELAQARRFAISLSATRANWIARSSGAIFKRQSNRWAEAPTPRDSRPVKHLLDSRPDRRSICCDAIYGEHTSTYEMESRQRRTLHSFARRSSPAPRLRDQQTYRATLRRHGRFPCGLALPDALPSGTTRLALWPLSRRKRTAPPCDSTGSQSHRFPAARLA
jgi:hypothetical protein